MVGFTLILYNVLKKPIFKDVPTFSGESHPADQTVTRSEESLDQPNQQISAANDFAPPLAAHGKEMRPLECKFQI